MRRAGLGLIHGMLGVRSQTCQLRPSVLRGAETLLRKLPLDSCPAVNLASVLTPGGLG